MLLHAQEMMELVLQKAGEDELKQIELAAAVKRHARMSSRTTTFELDIVENVKSWLKEIKSKLKGRFPSDIRRLYQANPSASV